MNCDPDSKLNMFISSFAEAHSGQINSGVPQEKIRQRLVEHLATAITDQCVIKTVGIYSTEHRLRVYVLTHDQLERVIQNRASRMHPGIPMVYEVERSAPS